MPWMGDYGARGILLPLTELIQRGRVNPTDFQPASWQGAQVDGVQYGIPLQTMPELLFYRSDLLDQYRLTPPESTDALLATARDLTSAVSDRYGVAWCGRRGMPVAHSFVQFMADFGGAPFNLRADCGDFFLATAAGEPLRPAFDTAAARAAAEFMMQLREVSPPDVTDMAWEEGIAAYASGRVALLYGWSCRAARFELDPHSPARGVTGYLPHPHGPGAATVSPMGGFLVGIPANVEPNRIDLVWRVVEWLASPEAMKLYVQNGSFVSPRFSVSADPEVAQRCQVISAVDSFAKRGEIKLWPRPPLPGMPAVLAVLGEEIHDMLLGRRSVAAALERAQARAEAALEALAPRQRRLRPDPATSGMGILPLSPTHQS
jgi:multiple sugar transport system substrate-binding protein